MIHQFFFHRHLHKLGKKKKKVEDDLNSTVDKLKTLGFSSSDGMFKDGIRARFKSCQLTEAPFGMKEAWVSQLYKQANICLGSFKYSVYGYFVCMRHATGAAPPPYSPGCKYSFSGCHFALDPLCRSHCHQIAQLSQQPRHHAVVS